MKKKKKKKKIERIMEKIARNDLRSNF